MDIADDRTLLSRALRQCKFNIIFWATAPTKTTKPKSTKFYNPYVAFICKVGLPVKDQGAEGRPYHGLYHCDQKPLDVILRLYEDGSVRLYCQSLFPLGQPKFDEWFGSVAFMRIKEALALVGELSSLRLKNGKGKEKRQVMDVKIKDVDWRKSLGEDELQRIGNGYRCLLVALIAAQVFSWNVNRR